MAGGGDGVIVTSQGYKGDDSSFKGTDSENGLCVFLSVILAF